MLLKRVNDIDIYENSLMDLKEAIKDRSHKKIEDIIEFIRSFGLSIGIPRDQIKSDIMDASLGRGKITRIYQSLYYADKFPEYQRNKKKVKFKVKRCRCKK